MSPAKTADPIEMPFGADSHGPREPRIDGMHIGATYYGGSISEAAAMRPIATTAMTTCFVTVANICLSGPCGHHKLSVADKPDVMLSNLHCEACE